MQVLVLGGTGSIGAAVVKALVRHRHEVLGLARNDVAAGRLSSEGDDARAAQAVTPCVEIERVKSSVPTESGGKSA